MTNYQSVKNKAAQLKRRNPEMTEREIVRDLGGQFQAQEVRLTKSRKKAFFPAGPASWVGKAVREGIDAA